MEFKKIKCKDYNACLTRCLECDLLTDKKCDKEFDFDTPKKFVRIERRDCNISWNECPTCRHAIGYRPDVVLYRCKRCGQLISWN